MTQTEGAAHRLRIFVETPGDYIQPLLAAYSDGSNAYVQAQEAFKADLRALLQALEEKQDANGTDHRRS
jgi:hypothetical protein